MLPTSFRETQSCLSPMRHSCQGTSVRGRRREVLSSFYWPGVTAAVKKFGQSCDICQRVVPKGTTRKAPLGSPPLVDTPFSQVAIDLVGPISPASKAGNRSILTWVDYATRYPEAVALKGTEKERVAEALMDIFCRIVVPREILSDRGTQFTSDLMKEASRLLGVKQLHTTPYHPQANGLVERFNGVLKSVLKKMCEERPVDWDRYLAAALFAYRGSTAKPGVLPL